MERLSRHYPLLKRKTAKALYIIGEHSDVTTGRAKAFEERKVLRGDIREEGCGESRGGELVK